MIRFCLNCDKKFNTFLSRIKIGKGKYCSNNCEFVYKKKIGLLKNANNPAWKGNEVTYNGLHRWLNKNFPRKNICNFCSERTRTAWAKIAKKYSRNIKDYVELCYSCHGLLDEGFSKKSILMTKKLREQLIKEGKTGGMRLFITPRRIEKVHIEPL